MEDPQYGGGIPHRALVPQAGQSRDSLLEYKAELLWRLLLKRRGVRTVGVDRTALEGPCLIVMAESSIANHVPRQFAGVPVRFEAIA